MKTAKKSRKVLTKKASYMSDEAFAELKGAIEDALAFERGKRRDLKVTRISGSPTAKAISVRTDGIQED